MPSASEMEALRTVSSSLSIVSCISSFFVILTYILFPKIRKLANTLVLYIAIADFVRSFVKSWGEQEDASPMCTMQGMFNNFGGCASFIWCCILSLLTYMLICHPMSKLVRSAGFKDGQMAKTHKALNCFVWPFVACLCGLPFVTDSYGVAGGWCWITHGNTKLEHVWRWVCFYAWVMFAEAVAIVVYIRCYLKLRIVIEHVKESTAPPATSLSSDRHSDRHDFSSSGSKARAPRSPTGSHNDSDPNHAQSRHHKSASRNFEALIRRIWMYPLILLCCWTPGVIRRCWQITHPDHTPYWMSLGHAIGGNIYGFVNAVVYCLISESKVLPSYKELFERHCWGETGNMMTLRHMASSNTGVDKGGTHNDNQGSSHKQAQDKSAVATLGSSSPHPIGSRGPNDASQATDERRPTQTVATAHSAGVEVSMQTISAPRPETEE